MKVIQLILLFQHSALCILSSAHALTSSRGLNISATTSQCVDETKFLVESGFFAGKERTCVWVGRKKQKRCNIPEATLNCPFTCNNCDSSSPTLIPSPSPSYNPTPIPSQQPSRSECVDERKFLVESGFFAGKERTCVWVGQKKQKRCNIPEATLNCPLTCGECVAKPIPSSSPTSPPSLISSTIPTLVPTLKPSVSSSPTAMYKWCMDSTERCEIPSVNWITGKKVVTG